MHKFVRSLITEWRKLDLPFTDATIVAGVSGGADSMSLLLALDELTRLNKLDLNLVIAHLNHKLRGRASDADENFVKKYAARAGFNFVSGSVKLSRTGNLEQNARKARYDFLAKTAKDEKALAVLTAHTIDDQAETFLFNLVRGSGPEGLSAMPVMRKLEAEITLVRPLLSWARRKDTEEYCRGLDVEYRLDSMNEDDRFTRVRIRKTVLPELARINPKIVETLARTAGLLGNPPGKSKDVFIGDLDLGELRGLDRRDLFAHLRSWIRSSRGNLRAVDLKHIEAIERLIHSQKSGKVVELPAHGRVVKTGGRLRFEKIRVEK